MWGRAGFFQVCAHGIDARRHAEGVTAASLAWLGDHSPGAPWHPRLQTLFVRLYPELMEENLVAHLGILQNLVPRQHFDIQVVIIQP